jgi:hypothetical protein
MEPCKINSFKIYNFTTLFFSKVSSNSNFFSKLRLVSIKSTKLKVDLQTILGSLGQYLLKKYQIFQKKLL